MVICLQKSTNTNAVKNVNKLNINERRVILIFSKLADSTNKRNHIMMFDVWKELQVSFAVEFHNKFHKKFTVELVVYNTAD